MQDHLHSIENVGKNSLAHSADEAETTHIHTQNIMQNIKLKDRT